MTETYEEFPEFNHCRDTLDLYKVLKENEKVNRVSGLINNTYFDKNDTDEFIHYWIEVMHTNNEIYVIDRSCLDNKRLAKDVYYKIFNCKNCKIVNEDK